MNQLNKLIQQYERENPGETAYVNPPMNLDFSSKFTRWLASRPTCGEEQRKFLDRLKQVGELKKDKEGPGKYIVIEDPYRVVDTIINDIHFPGVNLPELVEKKDE